MLEAEGRRSAHGTATCLPPLEEVLEDPPGLEAPPDEPLLLPRLLLELLPLVPLELEDGLVALPELEDPPGLVALPELPELLELSERIAKSSLPELGLIITSLMVPSSEPELPVTWAPISWLARNSC